MASTEIPPGSEPNEPRRSRGSRVLLGCAGFAIGAVIVILIVVAAFMAWMKTPGLPLEGRRLVDPGTVLYAELNVRPGDPVALELLGKVLGARSRERAMEKQEEIPGPLRWAFGRAAGGSSAPDLGKILPLIVMVTRQEGAEGVPSAALLALSFPKLGNRMRMVGWIVSLIAGWGGGDRDISAQAYRDEKLLTIDADGEKYWASFVGSDFLLARTETPLKWAIDRIKEPTPEGGAELLAARPEEALLYLGAREGYAGSVIDLFRRASPEFATVLGPLVEGAGAIRLWARLETPDLLSGEMRVAAGSPDEEEADEYAGSVTAVVRGGEITLALEPLPKEPGERHAWRVRVSGLEKVGIEALVHLEKAGAKPAKP